jgi:hypothetical protein
MSGAIISMAARPRMNVSMMTVIDHMTVPTIQKTRRFLIATIGCKNSGTVSVSICNGTDCLEDPLVVECLGSSADLEGSIKAHFPDLFGTGGRGFSSEADSFVLLACGRGYRY